MHGGGKFASAVLSYRRAISLKPENAEAYSNMSISFLELKRADEALESCDKAVSLRPKYFDARLNRGIVLQELDHIDAALENYNAALELEPLRAVAYSNRGNAQREMGHFRQALDDYDRAISIDTGLAEAYWNKALTLLLLGEFESGWPLYEWRWKRKAIAGQERKFGKPLWIGKESIEGKRILLHCEQGLGDTIQFCRFANLVAKRGAHVVMEVPHQLIVALHGLEGVHEWVERGQPLPRFDFQCPLMSLPLALGIKDVLVSFRFPYLTSDEAKRRRWTVRLGPRTRRRVGLVWSGNVDHKNDSRRSIALARMIEKMPPDFEYFSLQKEVREGDKSALAASTLSHFGDDLFDFSETAALCSLMDVVVSVDTSVAHLSAALGKRTFILIPYIPDWRWLLERTDSPWYAAVRLYRQDSSRDWDEVLCRVATDL